MSEESQFASYNSNGIVVCWDERWFVASDEEREKLNTLIEGIIKDPTKQYRKVKE